MKFERASAGRRPAQPPPRRERVVLSRRATISRRVSSSTRRQRNASILTSEPGLRSDQGGSRYASPAAGIRRHGRGSCHGAYPAVTVCRGGAADSNPARRTGWGGLACAGRAADAARAGGTAQEPGLPASSGLPWDVRERVDVAREAPEGARAKLRALQCVGGRVGWSFGGKRSR